MYLLRFFFFNVTATTEIYTYEHTRPLHDALPISPQTQDREGVYGSQVCHGGGGRGGTQCILAGLFGDGSERNRYRRRRGRAAQGNARPLHLRPAGGQPRARDRPRPRQRRKGAYEEQAQRLYGGRRRQGAGANKRGAGTASQHAPIQASIRNGDRLRNRRL